MNADSKSTKNTVQVVILFFTLGIFTRKILVKLIPGHNDVTFKVDKFTNWTAWPMMMTNWIICIDVRYCFHLKDKKMTVTRTNHWRNAQITISIFVHLNRIYNNSRAGVGNFFGRGPHRFFICVFRAKVMSKMLIQG